MAFSSLADELANALDDRPGARSLAEEFGLDFDGQDYTPETTPHVSNLTLNDSPDPNSIIQTPREDQASSLTASSFNARKHVQNDQHQDWDDFEHSLGMGMRMNMNMDMGMETEMDRLAFGHEAFGLGFEARPERGGYLGPKIEKDWRISLNECGECIISLSTYLRDKVETALTLTSSSSGNIVVAGNHSQDGVGEQEDVMGSVHGYEETLERHLGLLMDSERLRDEQSSEIEGLERAIGRGWEQVDRNDGSLEPTAELDIANEIEEEEEDEESYQAGWVGDASDYGIGSPGLLSPSDTLSSLTHLDPFDSDYPLDHSRHLDSMSHPHDPHPRHPTITFDLVQPTLTLPKTIHNLTNDTQTILQALQTLHDTLSQTHSMGISLNRQFRGIRSGIENWRERDREEDKAFEGVARWERGRVEDGLKGLSVKGRLEGEMRAFEKVIDDWGKRMGEIVGRREVVGT